MEQDRINAERIGRGHNAARALPYLEEQADRVARELHAFLAEDAAYTLDEYRVQHLRYREWTQLLRSAGATVSLAERAAQTRSKA